MPSLHVLQPRKIAPRLLLAASVVLFAAHWLERPLIELLLPSIRSAVVLLDDHFTINDIAIAHQGPNDTIQIRADFSRPVYVGGQLLYPLGSHPQTAGWMQIDLTLDGVLQYSLLMFIITLAWPASNVMERCIRIALTVPLALLLMAIHALSSILAELWFPWHDALDGDRVWPLLNWSRFLMGGGGVALAIFLSFIAIIASNALATGFSRRLRSVSIE